MAEQRRTATSELDRSGGGEPQVTSDLYQEEYRPSFVDKWDELIDWPGRAEGEGNFFYDILRRNGAQRVLDAATGTGYHAVMLRREGFDVTAADGAAEMIRKTQENAKEWNVEFPTLVADWRELSQQIDEPFDAVLCLGNAFTHLFDEDDRKKTLAEFKKSLKPGGTLIIDQRNYDSILDQGFSSKHSYYYCGREVDARPIEIETSHVKFQYSFPDGSQHYLTMYPIRSAKLTELMEEAGFSDIQHYGDFQAEYDETDADFIVHVARA